MKERKYYYKTVRADIRSLGLKRNPNILTYVPGQWTRLPKSQQEGGKGDWGGIWVATTPGEAKGLKHYAEVERTKDKLKDCRIFATRIGKVLFENPRKTRIKTDAVYFEAELVYLRK